MQDREDDFELDAEEFGNVDEVAEGEGEDGDSAVADEAVVACPYCGESCVISLDPGGGPSQEYVEDCQVCCRPWQVHVQFDENGGADVWLEETG